MLIKIKTDLYVEVADDDQAEAAAQTMDAGLKHQITGFPEGGFVSAKVRVWEHVSDEEAHEEGLVE